MTSAGGLMPGHAQALAPARGHSSQDRRSVPGPRRPIRVHGVPVRARYSLAEIGDRHALPAPAGGTGLPGRIA